MAGPAPGRAASPTMAVPVAAKIPAPMVAPTPSAVRCHLLSVRLRPPRLAMSFSQSSTDFRRKSWLIGPDLGEERVSEGDDGGGLAGHGQTGGGGGARRVEPGGAHHVFELPGVAPVRDFRSEHHAVDAPVFGHQESNQHRQTPHAARVVERRENLLPGPRVAGPGERGIGEADRTDPTGPGAASGSAAGSGAGTAAAARAAAASS